MNSVLPSSSPKGLITRRLSKSPSFSSFTKMKDFMALQDENLGPTGFIATKLQDLKDNSSGGSVLTRSKTRALSSSSNALKSREASTDADTHISAPPVKKVKFNDDIEFIDTRDTKKLPKEVKLSPEDFELIKKNEEQMTTKNNGDQESIFDIRVGAILILDDIFVTESSLDLFSVKTNRAKYLETMIYVRQLSTECSHHLGLNFIITQQSPLHTSGNSFIGDCVRTLRQNIDTYLVFGLQNKELKNLLMSVASGQEYQNLKRLYLRATEEGVQESPTDVRVKRPYLAFSLNPTFVDKTLKFR